MQQPSLKIGKMWGNGQNQHEKSLVKHAWMAELSMLCYLDPSEVSTGLQVLCPEGSIALQHASVKNKTPNEWFIFSTRAGDTVLVFRGTEPFSKTDWSTSLLDSKLKLKTIDTPDKKCKVHEGFFAAVDDVWEDIIPHLEKATSLWIGGHSLGGALAVIAGYR